jgi:Aspartyl protease/PDZ domain
MELLTVTKSESMFTKGEYRFTNLTSTAPLRNPEVPVSAASRVPGPISSPLRDFAGPISIPVELANGHAIVAVRLQGRDAALVLDTGSSTTTLDQAWAGGLGLESLGASVEAAGTDRIRVRLATLNTVELGNIELGPLTAALLPLGPVIDAAGRVIQGTLGYDLFQRFAVEIDYQQRRLRLWEGNVFVAPVSGVAVPVELVHRVPVILARVRAPGGSLVEARVIVDLGSSALGVRLSARFASEHARELAGVGGYAAPIGTGVGGPLLGRIGRLAELRVGPLVFEEPTVGIAQESKGALALPDFDGTVGAPVLERLSPILDYQRSRMILQPGEALDGPFRTDASGLMLDSPAPTFAYGRVWFVVPGSPAAEAGFLISDHVVAVDGTPFPALGLDQVRGLLRTVGVERVVRVRREGRELDLELRLRALV